MIRAENVSKYFGAKRALGPVSFEIDDGETVGFLGLNGAGKTTALRIFACDLRPSSGSVVVGDIDAVEHPHEVRKLVGFLPENPPLYGDMQVTEYLQFAGRVRGMSGSQLKKRLPEVIELTDLGDVRHDLIYTLSHGFRQRVGVAQAIVHDPKLLILDEPTRGLDPVQIVEMRNLVRDLKKAHTVLISSHILTEISETCDRILMLGDGEILASGTEESLLSKVEPGVSAWRIGIQVVPKAEGDPSRSPGIKDLLAAIGGVTEVKDDSISENSISYEVLAERDVRAELCRALVEAGHGVVRLGGSSRKLENIFLKLVQEANVRAISIIFRRELAAYLRSPVGYVIAALLLLVCGIMFQAKALGEGKLLSATVLQRFFEFSSGTTVVMAIALSIRLIAEERQTHTLILLNTSPVRDAEIIIGKFLAAFVFLAGMVVLSLYMPLLIQVNGKITTSQVVVGYIGLFLIGSASLAIGIFASSLSRHQLVAAGVGAALAGIMFLLYELAKRLPTPLSTVLQDLGLWHSHFQTSFMQGVFSLKDVVYYLAVTYFFLLLAIKTMEAKRWQ